MDIATINLLAGIALGAAGAWTATLCRRKRTAAGNGAAETAHRDELRDWEEIHRVSMEFSPLPIFAAAPDCELRYVFCNRKFAKLLNTTVQQVVGRRATEQFPAFAPATPETGAVPPCAPGETGHEDILMFNGPDGKRRLARLLRREWTLPSGRRLLLVAITEFADSGKMSGILQNAARQDAFFNMVMSLIPCQVFIKDAQDNFRYCIANKTFLDYYALPPDAVIGHADPEIFSAEVAAQLRANDRQTSATPGKLYHFDEDVSFHRERTEVFKSLKIAFRTEDGHLYMLGICVDVTDSARYITELQNTQRLFDLILNALPVNIFAKDADNEYRYAMANRTFAEFVGRPVAEIIGKTDAELFRRPADAAWFREQDRQVMGNGAKNDMVEHPEDCRGRQHHLQTSKRPATAPDGRRLLLGISMDVTELHDRITMEHVNNEILEKAVAEADFSKLLANITHLLICRLQCAHVLFLRHDRASGKLKLFHEECLPGVRSVVETGLENHEKIWQAHCARLHEQKLIVFDDFRTIPGIDALLENNSDYPTRSLAAASVFANNALFGVLTISYISRHVFSEGDRNLLTSMANVIALAAIRERQEQDMERANREKRAVFDNISMPIWLYDRDGRILQSNRAADERFGLGAANGQTPFPCARLLACPDPESNCPVRDALRTGQNESRHYRRDRNEYEVRTSPVFDNMGTPVGAVSSFYDITDLNLMIASRSAVKDCLADLLREHDLSKALRMILQKLCENLNADRCYLAQFDWTGKTVSCAGEYAPGGQYLMQKFQHIPFSGAIDWAPRFKDNPYLSMTDLPPGTVGDGLNAYPDGLWPHRVYAVFTHRIMMEGKLWGYLALTCEKPLRQLTGSETEFLSSVAYCTELMLMHRSHQEKIIHAMEQAKAADRAKSMFLSSMSHEIRTPLNAVIGFAELLKDNQLPEAARNDYLDGIRISGNALLSLINDVLDLSKLEADRMVFTPVKTDLRELLLETRRIFEQKSASKGVRLEVETTEDLPPVCVDCLRIRQLLFNLVGNAVKFTDAGRIVMRAEFKPENDRSGTLTISVADTGIGISEEDQRNIFTPFVQAAGIRGTRTANSGTGLGLALCRRMLEKMNGELSLTSEKGKGSDFRATIRGVAFAPRAVAEAEKPTPPPETAAGEIAPGRDLSALFVDDVAMNVKVGVALLAKLGAATSGAANAAEAWDALEKQPFDLLFTDLWMPGMNGCELAMKIRRSNRWPEMKIVALTADVDSGENFDMSVFDAVLTKPVSLDKLALFLKNHRPAPRETANTKNPEAQ